MTKQFTTDVLICGAGAAGLTLAIDLARRGVSFRLIEKRDAPFHGSRGKGIQPRTLEIFEDLGIVDRIVATGGLYPPQRKYREDGSFIESGIAEHTAPTPAEPYNMALMIPQFLTEAVMRERLLELGGGAEFGCELVGLEQDEDGVTARLSGGGGEETVRARYLVVADGGRSFVRHALNIGFQGKTLGVRAVVADVVLTSLDPLAWHRFNDGAMDRQISFCPLAGTELFQLQAPVPLEGEVDLSAEGLSVMAAERTGRNDIRIQSVHWASAYQMNARLAERYRDRHAFLIGDAAHIHPPTGGQGLNTSVQDAYNLGWKLAAAIAGASATLLDSYESERRPVAANMLGLSTDLLEAAKRGDMRRGRDVQQLDIGYPGSPLALEVPGRAAGPFAGARAPDAQLRGAAGQQIRLFGLLKGTHWTLLGYQVNREAMPACTGLQIHCIGADAELLDESEHFRAAYAVSPGDWVLVRPDGYIAAFVGSQQIDRLTHFLAERGLANTGAIEGGRSSPSRRM